MTEDKSESQKPKLPPLASKVDERGIALWKQCTRFLSGAPHVKWPAIYRELADFTESQQLSSDFYGEGKVLNDFEQEVATLLGCEAAVFMPSGTMAQQIALRIWCDLTKNPQVAFHPTSHLELNEHHAYAHLQGLKSQLIGNPDTTVLAEHIEALKNIPAAILIELPQRRTGGVLPTWTELEQIKAAAKERNIRLHMDGARLWECQPYYNRPLSDVCRGFDSVYVSFYKGLEGITGSMLCGSQEFMDQARIWQRRMGGNLYQLHPYVVSAKMQLTKILPRFGEYQKKAEAMGKVISSLPKLRVTPPVPQACMMHVHAPLTVAEFREFRLKVAERDRIWLGGAITESRAGQSYLELAVGEESLKVTDAEVRAIFGAIG